MILKLATGLFLLLPLADAWAVNKVIAECIPATNNTIFIATPTISVGISNKRPTSKLHLSSGTFTIDGSTTTALIVNPTGTVPAVATAVFVGSVTITNGAFLPTIKTMAQLDLITPAVGHVYLCSDCTNAYDICVGTVAAPSGFRAIKGTGGCGSGN